MTFCQLKWLVLVFLITFNSFLNAMDTQQAILVIDQGTTSTRALIFSPSAEILTESRRDVTQHYPEPGWVEQDALAIFEDTLACIHELFEKSSLSPKDIKGIGVTNQRETTVVWDKRTGEPVYNAIVWQDRRTSDYCRSLEPHADLIQSKTGLVIDPYFSASKIRWILDHIDGAPELAEQGHLLFGTIDTWLIWKFTGQHVTDITNASRTQLANINTLDWDQDLLNLFGIPDKMLPNIKSNHGHFGKIDAAFLGHSLPILASAGDQQAALIGQGCFSKGMTKSTLGTGCFIMTNTGDQPLQSTHKLLTTVAYQIQGTTHYALEGSIFNAGTVVNWLKDNLNFFNTSQESEQALHTSTRDDILFVPAFTGLGAPYWSSSARGSIFGLDRSTTKADITKAGLDALCYQSEDLKQAIEQDGAPLSLLRVDGGMAKNETLLHRMADICQVTVEQAATAESTALGAFYLAALELKWFDSVEAISNTLKPNKIFEPAMSAKKQQALYAHWQQAVKACLLQAETP